MSEMKGILPFIPAGSDFAKSRELFRNIGFEEEWVSEGYIGFKCGQARFILQDFNDFAFASNLMIKLEVANLDQWWTEINGKNLTEKYPTFKIKPPEYYPWGREVNFIDLAGVCWHVAQS
jgi:hypothetical protein